jgi:UDP:flavonoid glycosyltransferase YjiC (YdhE family)
MRALLTTYGSRGDVQPLVGLAVQVRAPRAAGVMPTGGWR